jgi:hypothetical protein
MTEDQAVPSAFVPAAPVWELVRRRQLAWGYSDDEMARAIGLGDVVDVRAWMLRSTAERILRRLAEPRLIHGRTWSAPPKERRAARR